MIGADLLKAERAIYYAALDILNGEELPEDMWAVVMDGAAGMVKDASLTAIAMQQLDWRQKALDSEARARRYEDACDGDEGAVRGPDGDRGGE